MNTFFLLIKRTIYMKQNMDSFSFRICWLLNICSLQLFLGFQFLLKFKCEKTSVSLIHIFVVNSEMRQLL